MLDVCNVHAMALTHDRLQQAWSIAIYSDSCGASSCSRQIRVSVSVEHCIHNSWYFPHVQRMKGAHSSGAMASSGGVG